MNCQIRCCNNKDRRGMDMGNSGTIFYSNSGRQLKHNWPVKKNGQIGQEKLEAVLCWCRILWWEECWWFNLLQVVE